MNIRDNPPLSNEDFRANLNRAMELHAASQLPLGAASHFEIVSPDPGREQLRTEILAVFAEDARPHRTEIVDAVMPFVDELAARARYMREAAELLARNVQSLTADLDSASSTNRNLHKLLQAKSPQVAELTKAAAPEPTTCECCTAASDVTGFKRGSCVGSPTHAWGCGHSFGSHFGNFLGEIRRVGNLVGAKSLRENPQPPHEYAEHVDQDGYRGGYCGICGHDKDEHPAEWAGAR